MVGIPSLKDFPCKDSCTFYGPDKSHEKRRKMTLWKQIRIRERETLFVVVDLSRTPSGNWISIRDPTFIVKTFTFWATRFSMMWMMRSCELLSLECTKHMFRITCVLVLFFFARAFHASQIQVMRHSCFACVK